MQAFMASLLNPKSITVFVSYTAWAQGIAHKEMKKSKHKSKCYTAWNRQCWDLNPGSLVSVSIYSIAKPCWSNVSSGKMK